MDALSPPSSANRSSSHNSAKHTSPPFDGDAVYVLAADPMTIMRNGTTSTKHSLSTTDGVDIFQTRETEYHPFLAWIHSISGLVVNDVRFAQMIILLIIVNSILMGVATFDFVTQDPGVERVFEIADTCFLLVFTIELVLQFMHRGFQIFSDGWLTFDFLVVAGSWFFSELQVIRAFRIFRTIRLITRIKALKELVAALLNVIPRMCAIAWLLALVFYIFAVLFTHLFKDLYKDGYTSADYFSRLDITLFTLFQIMTLDSWSEITKETMEAYKLAWIPFISFVILSTFIVINLIIAVICDAVATLQTEEIGKRDEGIQSLAEAIARTQQDMARLESKMDQMSSSINWMLRNQQQQQQQQQEDYSSSSSSPRLLSGFGAKFDKEL
eukprot:CAMPEP_0118696580 /NCGR_PEP_ID=MMETSP0800-20121206/13933_1 /TAXON_ID=210618 ORGANISM="Striatella unipunctata, Strain CCMP2910" /NCGR_SAMPLE_ID=MMETSP0800 /ASSEMBLY_ACC=CAM_ASM_000638 /LENGTH=383 /DNA_ID=CAMNT_0006595723 /DNA_START=2700 /DNA_END=3851 /DNA_ORIENTATION=-